MFRLKGRGHQLHHPLPGTADHAHLITGPGLRRNPVHHLRHIRRIAPGAAGIGAKGGTGAAKIHAHHVVAIVDHLLAHRALLVSRYQCAHRQMLDVLLVLRCIETLLAFVEGAPVARRQQYGRSLTGEWFPRQGGLEDVHRDPATIVNFDVDRVPLIPVRDDFSVTIVNIQGGHGRLHTHRLLLWNRAG